VGRPYIGALLDLGSLPSTSTNKIMKKDKYQWVNWWPEWVGFHFIKSVFAMKLIYDWYLFLGFWELRKWHDFKEEDLAEYQEERQADIEDRNKRG
jgi:hypothetical protein